MTRIFIGIMMCLLLLNCSKKEEKKTAPNKPYIISYEDQKLQKFSDSLIQSSSKIPPPPSTKGFFYGESQLIPSYI